MIHFNQLSISSDGKHLTIDVSVLGEAYYKDVYIDSIIIDNQDTYVGNGPSSTPVYSYSVPDTLSKLTKRPKSHKQIRLDLTPADITSGTLSGMFFVYVRTKGTPAADTPCGMDNISTMGTVVSMYPFYQKAMNYIEELASSCEVPKNFIDYILRIKGLELAVRTGNYTKAIKYYKKFFKGQEGIINNSGGYGCGCS